MPQRRETLGQFLQETELEEAEALCVFQTLIHVSPGNAQHFFCHAEEARDVPSSLQAVPQTAYALSTVVEKSCKNARFQLLGWWPFFGFRPSAATAIHAHAF